jgi:hypothetical protein
VKDTPMTRFSHPLLTLLFGASLACGALPVLAQGGQGAADAGAKRQVKAVVELFTSQGCSSCPSADALMEKTYSKRGDVLALSFSVDYWDYIGWKDTNASPSNSMRQRNYAKTRGDGAVYTPQMVVNGTAHAVGANGPEIDKAILRTSTALQSEWVPISAKPGANGVVIEVADGAKALSDTRVVLVGIKRHSNVKIERGENAGRAISYTNVVREFKQVALLSSTQSSVTIPRDQLENAACDAYAVLLQRGPSGPIIGAATIGNW